MPNLREAIQKYLLESKKLIKPESFRRVDWLCFLFEREPYIKYKKESSNTITLVLATYDALISSEESLNLTSPSKDDCLLVFENDVKSYFKAGILQKIY